MSECAFEPRQVEKPWGWELIWALTDRYCGKLLFVRAARPSFQYHEQKDESWYVQEGRAELGLSTLRRRSVTSWRSRRATASAFRPADRLAKVRALEDTLVIEVSTPESSDVVRLEDAYGREVRANLDVSVLR